MGFGRLLESRRFRRTWSDPVRRYHTLQSFAETEEEGGRDLRAAARWIGDASLRTHLERHAADEARHAEMFRRRAAELASEAAGAKLRTEASDKVYDLSRLSLHSESHGFTARPFDGHDDIGYIAMVHVAEKRAAALFQMHRDLNKDDPRTAALFDEILRDEKYHVSYTGKFLDKWRDEGRELEVRVGLETAKASRFMGAWKRLGVRSAAGLCRALMYVFYWTILLPFGLFTRSPKGSSGWSKPTSAAADRTQSQY